MKTNLIYSQNKNINNNMLAHKRKHTVQRDLSKQANTLQKYNRPAQAISFGGSAGLSKGIKKAFNKTVEFVNDNEAAYNAIYSLIVAGMLKPLFVLNMPGSEEKDKQIVATKNFLQAFLGSFLSITIGGGFIKKAIDVVKTNLDLFNVTKNDKIEVINAQSTQALEIAKKALKKEGKKPTIDEIVDRSDVIIKNFKDNHLKAFEQNPTFLREMKEGLGNKTTYKDAFETLWKNSTGALTAIAKAKISSLLLPGVMAFLFAKKNLEKANAQKAKENTLLNNSTFKQEQEQFQKMLNKNSNVAFKGNILTSAIDGTAVLIEKAGMSKTGEKLAKALSHAKKPSARMSDIESFAITAYWLQNTARSKKIEPSQKLGLNVHSALVTVVSSAAAFIIDWALDGVIEKSEKSYKEKLESIAQNIKSNPKFVIGETLDTTLKNTPDAIKMGIKDKVVALLNAKQTKEGLAEITDIEIETIVKELKATKTFKDFDLSEDLIKKAIESLKKSEPIRKEIAMQAQDLIGSKDIAKNLSLAIGNQDELKNAIKGLTKTYGKKLSKFKSLTIFTLVVRFLVPVLMVPFSGKLKKKIVEWTSKKPNAPKALKA